jgi:hypothetical protein
MYASSQSTFIYLSLDCGLGFVGLLAEFVFVWSWVDLSWDFSRRGKGGKDMFE